MCSSQEMSVNLLQRVDTEPRGGEKKERDKRDAIQADRSFIC